MLRQNVFIAMVPAGCAGEIAAALNQAGRRWIEVQPAQRDERRLRLVAPEIRRQPDEVFIKSFVQGFLAARNRA